MIDPSRNVSGPMWWIGRRAVLFDRSLAHAGATPYVYFPMLIFFFSFDSFSWRRISGQAHAAAHPDSSNFRNITGTLRSYLSVLLFFFFFPRSLPKISICRSARCCVRPFCLPYRRRVPSCFIIIIFFYLRALYVAVYFASNQSRCQPDRRTISFLFGLHDKRITNFSHDPERAPLWPTFKEKRDNSSGSLWI